MIAAEPVTPWRSALQTLELHTIQAEEGVFSYRETGSGEAIVFLHGISSGSGSWVHQLVHFQATARCIAWDAPGYGSSSALKDQCPSSVEYGTALGRFLDALRVEGTLIVAHSLGAIMASAFAAKHPDRVSGMVLLDPAIGYGGSTREEAEVKLNARLSQLLDQGVEGFAETRSAALVSGNASQEAIDLIRWNMTQLLPAGYTQAARMLATSDLLGDATGFPGKVLVECGTEDRITPEEKCRLVASAFLRGQYVGLQGLGHASYVEAPQVVNQHIAEFHRGLQNA